MDSNQDHFLNKEEKQQLLRISRESLKQFFTSGQHSDYNEKDIPGKLKIATGAFVSIFVNGKLRGCIGNLSSDIPIYKLVQKLSISAATQDSRFKSLVRKELDKLEIELSILTPMQRINDISEFELGRHGIYIKDGYNSGTFLPQVADHSNWTKEEFLGHCSRDKARIGWDGWKTAELYIYEAIVFKESEQGR